MRQEEEDLLLSALDNSVLCDFADNFLSVCGIGYDQGVIDGRAGKPMWNHNPDVPELFKHKYLEGYTAGRVERDAKFRDREIKKHMKRLGFQEDPAVQVVEHEEVKVDENPFVEEKSFIKTFGLFLVTFVGAGIVFGAGGWWAGKTQEQKRCMNIRRDMGVDD